MDVSLESSALIEGNTITMMNSTIAPEIAPVRPSRHWLRRSLKWLGILFAALILLALLAAVVGTFWLRSVAKSALPQLDGDLHVAGLSAPVVVRRDAHGVPHIEAANEADLFFAQGYITASERLWQMDMFRRHANGELAEVLGPALVEHDKMQRVLGFKNTAARIAQTFSAEDRNRGDAYARGVNAFMDENSDHLAPEFALLHYKPKPWTGADSMSIVLMMAQDLDSHWQTKLARDHIATQLHNPKLEADLYPVGSWRDRPPTGIRIDLSQPRAEPLPTDNPEDVEDDSSQTKLNLPAMPTEDMKRLQDLLGLPDCMGCASGSNNWVVSGAHTASGKPLLANDMHLGLSVPAIWFMADLEAPGYHAVGVTLPGVPFIVAGHNEHVAWGFTALYSDVQDLYVESLDGKGNYRASDGSWKPLITEHETIHVKWGEDVALDVQQTEHGPLLNPIFKTEKRAIALKWNIYDASITAPAHALYMMNKAQSWNEFCSALAGWEFPTQNLVYSDDQGHIAYHAIGRVPLRKAGLVGKLVAANDATHEWSGYIPFDGLPHVVDPPSGFIATANARVTTPQSPYELSLEWVNPYRIERIYKLLDGRDKLTAKDMLATQTDVYSEVDQELAHRFAYAIDHTQKPTQQLRQAADLMRSWDGHMDANSPAASVVDWTKTELRVMLLTPKLGPDAKEYLWTESGVAMEEIVMHANPDWLPSGYKNWDAFLTAAVTKALEHAPGNVSDWAYGSWHVVDLEHPLGAFLPLVGRVAGTGPHPLNGDDSTVKPAGRAFGASQRFTMDWSNVDGSTENISLGESGNPLSPYFKDQWSDWYNGTTFALPFSAVAVNSQTTHTLRLVP
jgi:penicillin G amidase